MKSKFRHVSDTPPSAADAIDSAAPLLHDAPVKELTALLKLFADENRLQILFLLTQHGELNVRTLCDMLQQNQPAVSHHLSLLRLAGVVARRREGKHNYYHMQPRSVCKLLKIVFDAAADESGAIPLGDFALTLTPLQNSSVTGGK